MNLFEKIQEIRVRLKDEDIKMTGRNPFAGYDYFELADFLAPVNRLMKEYKMTAIPSFTSENATLTAINLEDTQERWIITSPFGTAQLKGCHEVQNIGAVETYQRRYLYQALFDIAESDALNKTQGKPQDTKPRAKPTKTQAPTNNSTKPQTSVKPTQKCDICGRAMDDKLYNQTKNAYGKAICSKECKIKAVLSGDIKEEK